VLKKNASHSKLILHVLIALTVLWLNVFEAKAGGETLVIDKVDEKELIALGKNVLVKNRVKGVLVFGGDVTVEGSVEGDVATIGGSVFQKKGAYIGGDVIVFGGNYTHEDDKPLRADDKQTIIYAAYEEELRNLARNPTDIFTTTISFAFILQRLISVLFWFLISLVLTSIASSMISRFITRLRTYPTRVFMAGVLAFFLSLFLIMAAISIFPAYVSAIIVLVILLILVVSYMFGRVTLQLIIGKWVQKKILPEQYRSETIASLIGILIVTSLLSIPYLWALVVMVIWCFSMGIFILSKNSSQKIREN